MIQKAFVAAIAILLVCGCSQEKKYIGRWELVGIADYSAYYGADESMTFESMEEAEQYLEQHEGEMEHLTAALRDFLSFELKSGGAMIFEFMGEKYLAKYSVRERAVTLLVQDTPIEEPLHGSYQGNGYLQIHSHNLAATLIFKKQ